MRPVRVIWSDKDGERSVGLGGLHKLLAQDPTLRLVVVRGLEELEHCNKTGAGCGPGDKLNFFGQIFPFFRLIFNVNF